MAFSCSHSWEGDGVLPEISDVRAVEDWVVSLNKTAKHQMIHEVSQGSLS